MFSDLLILQFRFLKTRKIKASKSKEKNKIEIVLFQIRGLSKRKGEIATVLLLFRGLQTRKISMERKKNIDGNFTTSEIIRILRIRKKKENFKFPALNLQF